MHGEFATVYPSLEIQLLTCEEGLGIGKKAGDRSGIAKQAEPEVVVSSDSKSRTESQPNQMLRAISHGVPN